VAEALGVPFASPKTAADQRDLVFHASASAAGLRRALELLGPEGTVVELSWYGDREVTLALGGSFHSGRLSIRASQVGRVAPTARAGHTLASRRALALELLRDKGFDALITGSSAFAELPDVLIGLTDGSLPALCHVIDYSGA